MTLYISLIQQTVPGSNPRTWKRRTHPAAIPVRRNSSKESAYYSNQTTTLLLLHCQNRWALTDGAKRRLGCRRAISKWLQAFWRTWTHRGIQTPRPHYSSRWRHTLVLRVKETSHHSPNTTPIKIWITTSCRNSSYSKHNYRRRTTKLDLAPR